MAMSYLDKVKQSQQAQAPQQAAGLQGVSQNTQQQMAKYQQGYQPTQQAQTAQQNLQTVQAQKPQGYNSKYGPMLDSIMADINNQKDFKYEFNGDEAFRYFADVYGQKGKQASMDAMGQAAAMTGGYGNTFAQGAGQQAYQQYLMDLYGIGMDLRKQAQDQYNADRADLYNRLGAVQGMDESDYGRYRDTVQDYNADLDRAREDARYEDESGYQRYMDQLNYWQGLAQAENADYRAGRTQDMDEQRFAWQQDTDARDFAEAQMRADQDEAYRYATLDEQKRQADMDESFRRDNMVQSQQQFETSTKLDYDRLAEQIRQFDAGMSEDQRQYNQKMAASWVSDILSNGQIPSMDLLAMAGLSYEDAQKLVAQLQAGGPGGPGPDDGLDKEKLKKLQDQFRKNAASADYITPEERKEFLDWHNSTGGDQGPQYAPQTSNLDTPVHYQKQADLMYGNIPSGIAPKTATVTTTPIAYNAMLQRMFDEDIKKSKK